MDQQPTEVFATRRDAGCINMSPDAAAIYYAMSIPGDPVSVTGSSRAGTFDDGWTVSFKSWRQWRRGRSLSPEAAACGLRVRWRNR